MALPFNCHGTACHGLSLRRAQAMAVDAVLTEAHHSDSQHPEPINRSGLDPRVCGAAFRGGYVLPKQEVDRWKANNGAPSCH